MKTFCPWCEKTTECDFISELYICQECNNDFERSVSHYVKQLEEDNLRLREYIQHDTECGDEMRRKAAERVLGELYNGRQT